MELEPVPAMSAIAETFIQLPGVPAPKLYQLATAEGRSCEAQCRRPEAAAFCQWTEPLEGHCSCASLALKLPMTPNKEWLHMDTVELEKLHWTQDLPPLRRQQTQEVRGTGGMGLLLFCPELGPEK